MNTERDNNYISPQVTEVLLQNYKRFHDYLQRRIGNSADAEDVLQQSLLKALKQPATSVTESSIVSWFYTILRNSLIDYYRARASHDKKYQQQVEEDELISSEEFRYEICECMHDLLPTINPDYKDLIRKIDFENRNPIEVAQELGISRNNLDVKLHRARRALKKSLEAMCGACTEHACLNCSCKESSR